MPWRWRWRRKHEGRAPTGATSGAAGGAAGWRARQVGVFGVAVLLATAVLVPSVSKRADASAPPAPRAPAVTATPYVSTPWTPVGPAPIHGLAPYSGRATSVAIDPTTTGATRVMYLGTAGGGVWKTTDDGVTWTPRTDAQPSMAIGAVAIDPSDHNVILAGTGEPNNTLDSYLGEGVLRSTDGGTTWALEGQAAFGFRTSAISRIVFDPSDPRVVWAASTKGLYRSPDNGITWAAAPGLPANDTVDDLALDPRTAPATLYATVRNAGVYKHQAGSWTPLTVGLPDASGFSNRSVLALAPSNPDVLYLLVVGPSGGFFEPGSYNGLHYTTDAGSSWHPGDAMTTDVASFGSEAQGNYDIVLAVDPLDDDLLYVGGIDLAHAKNARGTAATGGWENLTTAYGYPSTGVHEDQHALAFLPGCDASPCGYTLANDGGIFRVPAPPPGPLTAVDDLNGNLDTGEFMGGDVGPDYAHAPLLVGGTQDNGTIRYGGPAQPPVPQGWSQGLAGDGGQTAVNWDDPTIVYTQQQDGYLFKSTDGGGSFQFLTHIQGAAFYGPLVIDRQRPGHLLFGATSVWETVDGGANWYASSPSFGKFPHASALAIDPTNSAVAYVGLNDGELWKTTTAGGGGPTSWTPVFNLPWHSARVGSISVDPADPSVITVGAGVFYDQMSPRGVFRSIDGGMTWTTITGNLPPLPVSAVVTYDVGTTRVVAAGTDSGVWLTFDDGAHWSELANGLPNVVVDGLAVDRALGTMVAFTHGRGAWVIPTFAPPPPPTTTTSTTIASTTTSTPPSTPTSTTTTPPTTAATTVDSTTTSPAAAAPAAPASPGPPAPAMMTAVGTLPATGSNPRGPLAVALALLAVGGMAVLAARRRAGRSR